MPGIYGTVAGFGHRFLTVGDVAWRERELVKAAGWLRDNGCRYAISGLALGFDSDWAEAALEVGLTLCAAVPFEGQDARWNRAQKARYAQLRAAAARVHVGQPIPDDIQPHQRGAVVNKRLGQRNVFMLQHATAGITDWEPDRFAGGTAGVLLLAARRELPGIHLDPVNRQVRFELPTVDQVEALALTATRCGHVPVIASRVQVDARMAGLRRARFFGWKARPVRRHEQQDQGCEVCLEELAIAAWGDAERLDPQAWVLAPVP